MKAGNEMFIQEIGAPDLIKEWQFLDPLRFSVPREDRMDLNKHPKQDGSPTFMAMPNYWTSVPGFEHMLDEEHPHHASFHAWCKEHELYTLAFNFSTLLALEALESVAGPEYITEIAAELYPSESNPFLGRLHGRASTYVSGCRGPLCRIAGSIAHRNRYLGKPSQDYKRVTIEETSEQISKSYWAYLDYINQIMTYRRAFDKRDETPKTHYSKLNKRQTILLDVTDESAEFLLTPDLNTPYSSVVA